MGRARDREAAGITFRIGLGRLKQSEIGELSRFEFKTGRPFKVKSNRAVTHSLSGLQNNFTGRHQWTLFDLSGEPGDVVAQELMAASAVRSPDSQGEELGRGAFIPGNRRIP
jgi:hypothetical protein